MTESVLEITLYYAMNHRSVTKDLNRAIMNTIEDMRTGGVYSNHLPQSQIHKITTEETEQAIDDASIQAMDGWAEAITKRAIDGSLFEEIAISEQKQLLLYQIYLHAKYVTERIQKEMHT